jgi:DnaJ-domain-containing protein 1
MTLGRRLWNVARAEMRGVFRRERPAPEVARAEPKAEARRPEPPPPEPPPRARPPRVPTREAELRQWYANLELPYGAGADEVRAAYRRLMRRYHPDLHHGDEAAQRVATELSQALRRAYEGLLAHLA